MSPPIKARSTRWWWRHFVLIFILIVTLMLLIVLTVQRSKWKSSNAFWRAQVKEYVAQRYSLEGSSVLGDQFDDTIGKEWNEFAIKQGGVQFINLVTQYCHGDWIDGNPVACEYSFQTRFNSHKFSMTYAVHIESDNGGAITSLRVVNPIGATMLLSKPSPYSQSSWRKYGRSERTSWDVDVRNRRSKVLAQRAHRTSKSRRE